MKTKLPVRPIPFFDESPLGLLIRIAEVNGYPNVRALSYAHLGRRCSLSWIAAAATLPERYQLIMNRLSIRTGSTTHNPYFQRSGLTRKSPRLINGLSFTESIFRVDGQFYCPACLREHKYWRKHWLLRPYSICPIHKLYLSDSCHSCGSALDIWRGQVDHCQSCGTTLSDGPTTPASSLNLEWWLELHSTSPELAVAVDDMYTALCQVDGDSYDPAQENCRLGALKHWIEKAELDPWLLTMIRENTTLLHPRILLLPLLRLQWPIAKKFIHTVLEQLESIVEPNMRPSQYGYLSNRDVELALGIKPSHMKHFFARGLFRGPSGEYSQPGQVWQDSVNDILFRLQSDSTDYAAGLARPVARSLASVVAEVMSGSGISVGYRIEIGLTSLRLKSKLADDKPPATNSEWLGLPQIAALLETYSEAARHLLKRGLIQYHQRDLAGAKRMIARRDDVEFFAKKFMLIGTFAKQINENPTNLAERVMALGVKAVYGPSIDGMLVYIFRREELENIDIRLLHSMKGYPTHAGRKSISAVAQALPNPEINDINVETAAELLNISHGNVLRLINAGQLALASVPHRSIHITRDSLQNLFAKLQCTDFISVEAATEKLGISESALVSIWSAAGVISIHNHVLWKLVSKAEVKKLEVLFAEYVTASAAGKMLGSHRSFLPNMERQRTVVSIKVGQRRCIRLYRRTEIQNMWLLR